MKRPARPSTSIAARVVTLVLAVVGAAAAFAVVSVALASIPQFQEFLVWLTTWLP